MKKPMLFLLSSLLLGLSFIAVASEENPGPSVGERFDHPLNARDQSGQLQSFDKMMGDKGLVIFFVRSADWCYFCKAQMRQMNERLPEFRALGLNVVSISVDEVPEIAAFANKQKIGYTMLADPEGAINQSLGIRDEQYPVGTAAFGVPRPILYVVDRNGTIRSRYMEPSYRTRPDLDIVLTDAKGLNL